MAAVELFAADRATTTVSSGGADAPSSGTQETWTVASSAMFGAASAGVSQFHVADPAAPTEIVAVTSVSGTTWTVTRGAENTTPVTHAAGFAVYQVVTTGWLGSVAAALNYQGKVQYSTTYYPGNVILYNGERIYITAVVTTGSGTSGLGQPFISAAGYVAFSSLGIYYAADYGVTANGSTDDWAALQNLLILLRSLTTNSFNGFRVILPSGTIALSKTLIIPTQTMLEGQGLYSTALKIQASANCDVVQPEEFNSSFQAALLTTLQGSLTAGNLRNAFRWGIRNLTIHGNNTQQSPGNYSMGLRVTTNPLTTAAGSDPDFDPAGIVENVQFRAATGDGFYHNGRSALRLTNCIAWFCNGNGYSPSFDTQIDHCQVGFSGIAGFYFNHGSDQGAGNKSYNNGSAAQWVTGSNYNAGNRVMYNGLPYDAINTLTGDTTAPPSDPANWAAVTATSPAAWGTGAYFDSNVGEVTFNCDCQENSSWNWYFHDCTLSGIYATGCSFDPNFNYSGSVLNSTNPDYYADVCVDGSTGIQAAIVCGSGSGHTATQYRLRMVNAPARCDLTLTGDTNATFLTPDSITLAGSGNSVSYNGVSYTSTLAAQNDVSISSPGNGQVLAYNATTSEWQNSSAGATFNAGIFGDGYHGAVTLDGVTNYSNFAILSGSTYTLSRDLFASALTINSGVTLITANNIVFSQTEITNNGTISENGNNASGSTPGATSTGAGQYSSLGAGGAGGAGQITTGSGAPSIGFRFAVGNGGGGGAGSSGAGGAGVSASQGNGALTYFHAPARILAGVGVSNSGSGTVSAICGGGGGGGGGGDGTNKGGGGGGGAGMVVIFAPGLVNSSTGIISAAGGNGAGGVAGNAGGGGGGAGGLILIYTQAAWTNNGTANVANGSAGTGSGTGLTGTNGTAGNILNVILQ